MAKLPNKITSINEIDDDEPLRFGSYKGKSPNEIFDIDSVYLLKASEYFSASVCSEELLEKCREKLKISSALTNEAIEELFWLTMSGELRNLDNFKDEF